MRDKINLIFDFDGTLADSYDSITDVVCRLFLRYGVTCDPAVIRERAIRHTVSWCVGVTAEENGLDPDELREPYRTVEEDSSLIRLYPDAAELVSDPRFRCFVYTHRGENCRVLLERAGIADRFEEIVDNTYGLKNKPSGEGIDYLVDKYALDRRRTYYVGDRTIDIECGVNAGVKTVFFNSSGLPLDCPGADFTVSSLAEIPDLPL